MNIGLYQAVSGMKANQQYQDILAANLAGQSVAGQRGTIPSFSVNMPDASKLSNSELRQIKEHPFVKINTHVDVSEGPLRETSNAYNFAIAGNAFFSIQESDGNITLTRNGQFRRNQDDELVTVDGAKVLMEGNQPVKFSSKSEPVVTQGGEIKVDGQSLGKLSLVKVQDPKNDLVASGTGRLTSKGPTTQVDKFSTDNKVMQGYVEDSNINSVQQMVSMIQVTRLYEAGQKAVEAHDQSTEKLIQATGPR